MRTDGFTLVLWKPYGLTIRYANTWGDIQDIAIGLGLYDENGNNLSGDKWAIFGGEIRDGVLS